MKANRNIEFLIFLFSFVLIITSVLAAVNDRFDPVNVFLSLVTWGPLYGAGFVFSWFFRRRNPKACDLVSLLVAVAVTGYFFYYWFGFKISRGLELFDLIQYLIWLQVARSFALKEKKEFYLTYFLSFVLVLYGAYTGLTLFFFSLFIIYFISGALVLSLETVADFDLEKINRLEKRTLFLFFSLIFSLAFGSIILVALVIYSITPKWSWAPYVRMYSPLSEKADPNYWKQIYGQEFTRRLCNKTDLDRMISQLVKPTLFARNLLEEQSPLKLRAEEKSQSPPPRQPPPLQTKMKLSPPPIPPQPLKTDKRLQPPPPPPPLSSKIQPSAVVKKPAAGQKSQVAGQPKVSEKVSAKTQAAGAATTPSGKTGQVASVSKTSSSSTSSSAQWSVQSLFRKFQRYLWLLLLLLLLVIIYLLRRSLRGRRLFTRPEEFIIFLYRQALKKLSKKGYPKKGSQTPEEYWQSLPDSGYLSRNNPLVRLSNLFEIAFYSGQKIIYSQMQEATGFYREITESFVKKLKHSKKNESRSGS